MILSFCYICHKVSVIFVIKLRDWIDGYKIGQSLVHSIASVHTYSLAMISAMYLNFVLLTNWPVFCFKFVKNLEIKWRECKRERFFT